MKCLVDVVVVPLQHCYKAFFQGFTAFAAKSGKKKKGSLFKSLKRHLSSCAGRNHVCITLQLRTQQINTNPRKRTDNNRGKLIGRHEEGNESLILLGSVPNNLSLAFIAALKSQRGSNLNGSFLPSHFLYSDISFFTQQWRPTAARLLLYAL